MDELEKFEQEVSQRAQGLTDLAQLAALRATALGKKTPLAEALRRLKNEPAGSRAALGAQLHARRQSLVTLLQQAEASLSDAPQASGTAPGYTDISLPGRGCGRGAAHPLRLIEDEVVAALTPLGFELVHGPLVEHVWYNFEALNMAADHPARDMHDTFFIGPDVVLRTHTSNVQVRTMRARTPPIRILAPGMVFRHDAVDATHSPAFFQLEGLWVDAKATLADLKGVLRTLTSHLFGPTCVTRFRPSYFPFTEPSCEVDVRCGTCATLAKTQCRICKGNKWLEVLGAGMVHPHVLAAVDYDAEEVQGFAFGVGLDRIAMLKWGIDDIRLLYENDMRFLHNIDGTGPGEGEKLCE